MDKEEICKVLDLLNGAGYEVEYIGTDKFPNPPSNTFTVRFTKRTNLKGKKLKTERR